MVDAIFSTATNSDLKGSDEKYPVTIIFHFEFELKIPVIVLRVPLISDPIYVTHISIYALLKKVLLSESYMHKYGTEQAQIYFTLQRYIENRLRRG